MRRTSEPVEMLSVAEALAQLREAKRRRDEATARRMRCWRSSAMAGRMEVPCPCC